MRDTALTVRAINRPLNSGKPYCNVGNPYLRSLGRLVTDVSDSGFMGCEARGDAAQAAMAKVLSGACACLHYSAPGSLWASNPRGHRRRTARDGFSSDTIPSV